MDGLGHLKKFNDLIGNRTRDLPACSTLPRSPLIIFHIWVYINVPSDPFRSVFSDQILCVFYRHIISPVFASCPVHLTPHPSFLSFELLFGEEYKLITLKSKSPVFTLLDKQQVILVFFFLLWRIRTSGLLPF
jgi:hypothetical protein